VSSQVNVQLQSQIQVLNPQQLLVSELVEMPAEALYERVDRELKENVSLEADRSETSDYADGPDATVDENYDENSDSPDYADSSEYAAADYAADYSSPDDIPDNLPSDRSNVGESYTQETQSFYDQLEEQIGFFHLTPHEEEILRYLIGSLDDDGLLHVSLQQLQDELEVYHNIPTSPEELEHILGILQNFEPAGIGARSLQECLILQVQHAPDSQSPVKQQLLSLLKNHFDDLMLKHWDRIQRTMRLSDADVSRLKREVHRLNPRPGSSMGEAIGRNIQQITPDFYVDTDAEGRLTLTLNNGHLPPLHVSQDDIDFLNTYEGRDPKELSRSERDGVTYLRDRVDKAQGFIEALRQRRQTLSTTMQAIMKMQRPFFESGDETLLAPMTLEDVAKRTGLHLSTVSRVSNSKWVQTPFGIYPLRWFFTSAARLQGGDEVSVRNIQAAVQEIVDNEDHNAPLSDDAIARELQQRGYDVARRTVSKYREQLNIPVARLRK